MRSQHGFTLIEVLISAAIFAIIGVMAYGGLSNIIKAKQANWAQMDDIRELQMAFVLIQNDLLQTINRDSFFNQEDKHQGAFFATSRMFTLVRAGQPNPLGETISPLARVTYRLDDTKLLREVWYNPDSTDTQPNFTKRLLDNVDSLNVECTTDKGKSWESGCQTTSSVDFDESANPNKGQIPQAIITNGILPHGIRLTLKTEDLPKIIRVFEIRSGYD